MPKMLFSTLLMWRVILIFWMKFTYIYMYDRSFIMYSISRCNYVNSNRESSSGRKTLKRRRILNMYWRNSRGLLRYISILQIQMMTINTAKLNGSMSYSQNPCLCIYILYMYYMYVIYIGQSCTYRRMHYVVSVPDVVH